MRNMGSNKEEKQMLEGDADYTVSQPLLFAMGPGCSLCQFCFLSVFEGEYHVKLSARI